MTVAPINQTSHAASPATEALRPRRALRWVTDPPGWLKATVLLLAVFLAYLPAIRAGFIWDDDAYLTDNHLLTASDGWQRIWFSTDAPSQYFPLVYSMFRLERGLWGLHPAGYHVVNILLHAGSALLVWWVLKKLSIRGAWLAAALFALHPVQVESVAWVTERKNVLSTSLYLLALLSWMRFTDHDRRRWGFYALALSLYLLALFAKTTACTLPAALVLVLWWRRQKLDWRRALQIVPFVLAGLAMGLLAIWWERNRQGTQGDTFDLPFLQRLLIASRAIWFYLGKLLWPAHLCFSYPQWPVSGPVLRYVPLAACVAAAGMLWRWRRPLRGIAGAMAFFVAALLPMLGFIPLYTFAYAYVADHYQYVASIGIAALVGYALSRPWPTLWRDLTLRVLAPGILLLVLGTLTWSQAHIYRDEQTLWQDTLAKNPASWMAHNNYGICLLKEYDLPHAQEHFEWALQLKPNHPQAHVNLGRLYEAQGSIHRAMAEYRAALAARPNFSEPHYQMGRLYFLTAKPRDAIGELRQATQINPDHEAAHHDLAVLLTALGRTDEAIPHYQKVLRLNPASTDTRMKLAAALAEQGRWDQAVTEYRLVLEAEPQSERAKAALTAAVAEQARQSR